MHRLALLALAAALAAVPAARAGGDWLPVAATAGRIWVADGSRVLELDAATARVLRSVRVRFPYATELATGAGCIWAASVAQGFVAGAVTRISAGADRGTNVLVLPQRPVYEVAATATTAWALTGPHAHQRLARLAATSTGVRFVAVPSTLGFLAADPSGAVPGLFALTSRHVLLRYDDAGQATRIARIASASGPPAIGLGSVWLPGRSTLVRLDPATGRVEGRLRLAGADALTAVAGDAGVFLLELRRDRTTLLRVDPARMRVTGRVALPAVAGERLALGERFLWLTDSRRLLWRIDPRTLERVLFARPDGAVQSIGSVVNPEKLGHLGELADLRALLRRRS